MLDFTAIDFETANSYRGSPCAVGLVRVRDGKPVDERRWLIRPPEPVDYFDGFNTMLHGIDAAMVADAPRWHHVLPAILDYIGDDVVVAHNAGFDIGVVRYACAVDNIEWPEMRFLCSMVMARRALSLPSYRLPYVVETLGARMGDHHDPLADAHAVVAVVRALSDRAGVSALADLAASQHMSIGRMSSGIYTGSVALSSGSRNFTPIEVNTDADPSGYLYGRVVVFTGTLMSMTRDIARHECARVGATPEQNTTKRTNVLVVGDINPAVLRPGSNVTGKARKAFELQDKGQAIEVMTEDDFVRCLEGKPLAVDTDIANLLADPLPASTTRTPPRRGGLRSIPSPNDQYPHRPSLRCRPGLYAVSVWSPSRSALRTPAHKPPPTRHVASQLTVTRTSG